MPLSPLLDSEETGGLVTVRELWSPGEVGVVIDSMEDPTAFEIDEVDMMVS